MADEALISKLLDVVGDITKLGGQRERTTIVPNILVVDATPSDLPTGYIKIRNPRDGTNVPCLAVNGLIVADNDLVNVLFTEGTEPIALTQGSQSPSSNIKVSELWESDFGAVAWQTDASGHLSATGKNLTTTGNLSVAAITASGNITLPNAATAIIGSGSSNPELGASPSGNRWGNIYLASATFINALNSLDLSVGSIGSETVMVSLIDSAQDVLRLGIQPGSGDDVDVNINDGQVLVEGSTGDVDLEADIYPNGDNAGLFERNVNHWQSPIDHFTAFSGWTWAAYAGFVTPGNISVALSNSLVRIANTATEGAGRAFAYQGSYGADIRTRCAPGALDTRTGLRMDDGSNNNYIELFLEPSGGLMKLRYRYAIGGVVTGPTDLWGGGAFPSQFVILRLIRSGDNVQLLYTINTAIETFLTLVTITGWTPSRSGIYHEHTSGSFSSNRASQFDWYSQ